MPGLSELEKYAKNLGYKSANLMVLQDIAAIAQAEGVVAEIPQIQALGHEAMQAHLAEHLPELDSLWQDFLEAQGEEIRGLSEEGKPILDNIRQLIKNTFLHHPLPESIIVDFLDACDPDDLLMVRSTGKEDSADLANPGGNESIAAVQPTQQDISIAVGKVIASYFSEKSLEQRIKGKDDISAPPFIPVLLQKMIGEPLEAKIEDGVISGVLYTSEYGSKIQMAPGHGELIVNSKAPFDSFYVTREAVVHSQIAIKPQRLVSKETQSGSGVKRSLEMVNNDKDTSHTASVSEDVVRRIAAIGNMIEREYDQPMDVEFVYKPKTDTIYIVQARPIPKGDLKHVMPSTIKPEKIKQVKKEQPVVNGHVISPAGEAVQIITKKSEILICQDIETALDIYLRGKNENVKAVVVRNMAPATSHEAAEFNSKAIPVIQVNDLAGVEAMLDEELPCVIIDPQHKLILDWHDKIDGVEAITDKLYAQDSGLLTNGLFKSSMGLQQTVGSPPYAGRNFNIEQTTHVPKDIKIGALFALIEKGSPTEAQEAFSQLATHYYALISHQPREDKIQSFDEILQTLESIESSNPSNVAEGKIALQRVMDLLFTLARSKNTSEDTQVALNKLLQNGLATGLEIESLLTLIDTVPEHEFSSYQSELLNLVSRLEAIMVYPGNKDVFSSSLVQVLAEEKATRYAQATSRDYDLTHEQQGYLAQFLKISHFAINPELKGKWEQFAIHCCRDPMMQKGLAQMMGYMVKNDLSSFLINSLFEKAVKQESIGDNVAIFKSIFIQSAKAVKNTEAIDLVNVHALINKWQRHEMDWADPGKFEKLHDEFILDFNTIIANLDKVSVDKLGLTEKMLIFNEVNRLTETLDTSLKHFKGSLQYTDKALQAHRFAELLTPYHVLMVRQVSLVPSKKIDEFKSGIGSRTHETKDAMLMHIQNVFDEKKRLPREADLSASRMFGVNSAVISSPASFERQFLEKSQHMTLEDLFTLFHQNIIAANTVLTEDLNLTKTEMPAVLQELLEAIDGYELEYGGATFPANLVSARYEHPNFHLQYNLPLAMHAASFEVRYNAEEEKLNFSIKMFGEARSRFAKITKFTDEYLNILGADVIKSAQFSEGKSVLECELEVDATQPNMVLDVAKLPKMMSRISFHDNKFSLADVAAAAIHYPERQVQIGPSIINLLKDYLFTRGARLGSQDTSALIDLCMSLGFQADVKQNIYCIIKKNAVSTYWLSQEGVDNVIKMEKSLDKEGYIDKLSAGSTTKYTFLETLLLNKQYTMAQVILENPNFKAKEHPLAVSIVTDNKDYSFLNTMVKKGMYSKLNPQADKDLSMSVPVLHEALQANEMDMIKKSTGPRGRTRRPPTKFRKG
tara:strand:- start:143027 stop:147121 length:4095 start_codon:yes stop_codon:yes gene_type:complete